MNTQAPPVRLTVVAPMFNESEGIAIFLAALRAVLESMALAYQVVLVDDGSVDDSVNRALEMKWQQLEVLSLDRNRGHQVALEVGLAHADGDYVVTMDSDGQHPVDLLPSLLRAAKEMKVEVVYTERVGSSQNPQLKTIASRNYYRIVRWMTRVPVNDGAADFRLMSKRVVRDVLGVKGPKVMRLLLPSVGYPSTTIRYQVRGRIAGSGRFSFQHQLRLGIASLLDFSSMPLRLMAGVSLFVTLLTFLWLCLVAVTFLRGVAVQGWASVISAVLVVGSLTLFSLAVIGEYLARIYSLLKNHPQQFASRLNRSDH